MVQVRSDVAVGATDCPVVPVHWVGATQISWPGSSCKVPVGQGVQGVPGLRSMSAVPGLHNAHGPVLMAGT